MRTWSAALIMLLALSPVPGAIAGPAARAAQTDTTWMAVMLGGRQIGHLRVDRVREATQVVTTQDLRIELHRSGKSIPVSVVTRSVEAPDGQPLGFSARSTLSASETTVEGARQPDGRYAVTATVAGIATHSTLSWPAGALLSDGQRQAMADAAGRPGRYVLNLFDPVNQAVIGVDMEVLGEERVALPEGVEELNHQRETLRTPRGVQHMDLWLDARGRTRKGSLTMLGHDLEMVACSEACALAPVQSIDMLRASMVDAPQPVSSTMRQGYLRYVIHVSDGEARPLIATDEQRVVALGGGNWMVDVGPSLPGGQPPPTATDTTANAWVQSDAPAIREMAARAVVGAQDDQQKMRQLRDFVASYITDHTQEVGYLSALDVVRLRAGDCKEAAVLLAALARAQRIPARVVTGMVYAERYAGNTRVFVPHAWVQGWINGRWQSFDAALGQFDSTHIALDSGDGDPWHFANLSSMFGQLRIAQIGAAPEPSTPTGAAVASNGW